MDAEGVALDSGRVEMRPAADEPAPKVPAEIRKADRLFWSFNRPARSAAWAGTGTPLELPGGKLALLIVEPAKPGPSRLRQPEACAL